jgi:UDPglucose 6-dehydrogenase
MNDLQKRRFVNNMLAAMFDTAAGKRIAILGFAFKKDTGDTRESAAIYVCKYLMEEKAKIAIYDPQVDLEQIYHDLFDTKTPTKEQAAQIDFCASAADAAKGAHALACMTEWDEFKSLNFKKVMKNKKIILYDLRNLYNTDEVRKKNIKYFSIGRPNIN